MTRDDIYNVLESIVVRGDGFMEHEEHIIINDRTIIYIDTFLSMFGVYDLTLKSLLTIESEGWKSRFRDWNERGVLPD